MGMSRLTFIIPEHNTNLRIGRLLLIIDELSYSSRGNPILNIERLAIFDFLVRYPLILYNIKKVNMDIDNLELIENEIGTIESRFPNNSSLYNYKELYTLLKVLSYYQFIAVQIKKGDFYYYITEDGKSFANALNSQYFKRIRELCKEMKTLRSTNTRNLKQQIQFSMKEVE
jgi:hypothetical protein